MPNSVAIIPRPCAQKPNPAPASLAGGALADQFDTGGVERPDELFERIDIAANDRLARFHALDGGQREAGEFRELPLIDLQQRPRGAHLP